MTAGDRSAQRWGLGQVQIQAEKSEKRSLFFPSMTKSERHLTTNYIFSVFHNKKRKGGVADLRCIKRNCPVIVYFAAWNLHDTPKCNDCQWRNKNKKKHYLSTFTKKKNHTCKYDAYVTPTTSILAKQMQWSESVHPATTKPSSAGQTHQV